MAGANAATLNLRAECWGHGEDVRGLGIDNRGFLTASRDKLVKLWTERDAHSFDNSLTLVGHEDYVGAVAYIPPNTVAACQDGAIVSGSRDKSLIVWDAETGQKLRQLHGHKWQVTSVAILADGSIASASLDGTIRVWDSEGDSQVLEGHEGPVQCLLVLPDGGLLSGSNDKTIRLWHPPTCIKTITGHTDTVRGLALVPGLGFISASHDTTLQLWTTGGDPIATLAGHTALVYSAAATADGLIASASEDNTARLWRADGTCLQVLEHPACVWDVAFLPNSDLVTGCADFAARVWTASADRTAPAEAIRNFQQALEARKSAAKGADAGSSGGGLPDGLKMEDPMALLTPGTRDGQTKIIREGGAGIAYNWSSARNEWEKLGEVVGGPAPQDDTMAVGGKQLWGQSWDYVFDVDIADGEPIKKLPVNRGEDPYDAADRFMEREGMPVSYREQIVDFIVQNSHGGVNMPDVPMNVDPFTGGGAYVPAGFGAASSAPGSATQHTVTGGGYDPFTGGSSAAKPSPAAHVPVTPSATFATVPNTEAIARKVRETSGGMAGTPDLALSEDEGAAGGVLEQLLSRASSRKGATAPTEQLALLAKLLRWPAAVLFPALDIARLLALDPAFAPAMADAAGSASDAASGGIGGALATAMAEPQSTANQQTALRLACNLFQHGSLRAWVSPQAVSLLDGFSPALQSTSKAVRLGVVSFMLNCAVFIKASDVKLQLLSGLAEILGSIPDAEPEAQYRALVAIGTLAHEDSMLRGVAADLGVPDQVRGKRQAGGKVGDAAQELLAKF